MKITTKKMSKKLSLLACAFLGLSSCVQQVGPRETEPDPIVFYKPGECVGSIPRLSSGAHDYCFGARVMNGESQGSGVSYRNVGTVKELFPKQSSTAKDEAKIYIEDQRERAPEYGYYTYTTERLSRAYRCILRSAATGEPGVPTVACQGQIAYDRQGKKVVITEVFSNGYARVFFKENRPTVNGVIENKITETRELNNLRPLDSEQFYRFDCIQLNPQYCSWKF